jgi:cytochrome c-type biogenesis protein CcmH
MNQEETLRDLRRQWQELHARQAGLAPEALAAERAALEQRIVAAVVDDGTAGPAPATNGNPAARSVASPAPAVPPARVSGRLWATATAFVLALAGAGYAWKGSPRAVGTPPPGFDTSEGGAAGGARHAGNEQLDALVKQLQERLTQQPGDVEGWALLARSQMALGRYAEASAAYEKARALKPDDAGLLTDHADALGVLNGRTLEGEPARLLERALKIDPRHIKALVLAGTLEFQRGNYAAAQKRWEEVVKIGPAGDGLVELAREGATQAQARQQQAGAAPARPGPGAAAPPAPVAAAGGVSGTVRLSAALKARASPDDTVFIFARAAEGAPGGGMPLAIMKKRVADLPAAFTLDDSQAMSPAARLSTAKQVVVTARISKSGQAMPQAGDLEGSSTAVAPGARDVVVEISAVRR